MASEVEKKRGPWLERKILAAAVTDPEALARIRAEKWRPEWLEHPSARVVLEVLLEHHGRKGWAPGAIRFDALKLIFLGRVRRGRMTQEEFSEHVQYLGLLAEVGDSDSFEFEWEEFKEWTSALRLRYGLEQARTMLADGEASGRILSFLSQDLVRDVRTGSTGVEEEFEDLAGGFVRRYAERQKAIAEGRMGIVPTGYTNLDTALGGGHMIGRIGFLFGLPKIGKSIVLTNWGVRGAVWGAPTLHVTTENTMDEASTRAEGVLLDLNPRLLELCRLGDPEKLLPPGLALKAPYKMLRLYPNSTTMSELLAKLEAYRGATGFQAKLLIVDSADWLKLEGGEAGEHLRGDEKIKPMLEKLKAYAEEEAVAGWVASHVKNEPAKNGYKHTSSQMSAAIEKNRIMDVAVGLARSEEMEERGIKELYVDQIRWMAPENAPTCLIRHSGQTSRIEEVPESEFAPAEAGEGRG